MSVSRCLKVQGHDEKILHWGVQGGGKSLSGYGLDGVHFVQGQMKGSLLKGSDQDHG